MPITPQENVIELSDFTGGWQPDLERGAVEPTGLLDVRNLLPDIGTGTPQTRDGFERIIYDLHTQHRGYDIQALHAYNRNLPDDDTTSGRYLIAVMTNTSDNMADNVRIVAAVLYERNSQGVETRIETAGYTGATLRTISPSQWQCEFGDAHHYGMTIDGTFYGGGRGVPMYSWNPDDGFIEEVALGDYPYYYWDWANSQAPLGGTDERQTVTIDSGTGRYQLGWKPPGRGKKKKKVKWSTELTEASTAGEMTTALQAISWLDGQDENSIPNVTVTLTQAGPSPDRAYRVEFSGKWKEQAVPLLRVRKLSGDIDVDITVERQGFAARANDYAFGKGDTVRYNDHYYGEQAFRVAKKSRKTDAEGPIYQKHGWKANKSYKRGDRITVKRQWENIDELDAAPDTATYPRTFEARKNHDGDEGWEPGNHPAQNEIQRVTVNGRGFWRLHFDDTGPSDPGTTNRLSTDVSAASLQLALENIDDIGVGNVSVTEDVTGVAGNTVQRIKVADDSTTAGHRWALTAYHPASGDWDTPTEWVGERVHDMSEADELPYMQFRNTTQLCMEKVVTSLIDFYGVTANDISGAIVIDRAKLHSFDITFKGVFAGTQVPKMHAEAVGNTNAVDDASCKVTSGPETGAAHSVFFVEFIEDMGNRPVPLLVGKEKGLKGGGVNVHRTQKGRRGWQDYWTEVTLGCPRDDPADAPHDSGGNTPGQPDDYADYVDANNDWIWAGDGGEINDDWDIVPEAAITHIATFWGERVWLRYDNVGPPGKSRLQYSHPLKPNPDTDIGDLTFDPEEAFAIGDDNAGDQGGYIDIRSAEGDDIQCLLPYGQYLLIFKERSTWVLSGQNEDTWTLRRLGDVGAAGPRSAVVVDGIAYFIGSQGVHMTDGTQLQEVPGGERVRDWLRDAASLTDTYTDDLVTDTSNQTTDLDWLNGIDIVSWGWNSRVWFSLPLEPTERQVVSLVYDIPTESFWLQDLAPSAVAISRVKGTDELFFALPMAQEDINPNAGDQSVAGTEDPGETEEDPWEGHYDVEYKGRTIVNLFKDPGFELQRRIRFPWKHAPDRHPDQKWERLQEARERMAWYETAPDRVRYVLTAQSYAPNYVKLGHRIGAKVANQRVPVHKRHRDEDGNVSQPTSVHGGRRWEGLFQKFKLMNTWDIVAPDTDVPWTVTIGTTTSENIGYRDSRQEVTRILRKAFGKVAVNRSKTHPNGSYVYRVTFMKRTLRYDTTAITVNWNGGAATVAPKRHRQWRMRAWVRNPNWKKDRRVSYKNFRFFIAPDSLAAMPTNVEAGAGGYDDTDFHNATVDLHLYNVSDANNETGQIQIDYDGTSTDWIDIQSTTNEVLHELRRSEIDEALYADGFKVSFDKKKNEVADPLYIATWRLIFRSPAAFDITKLTVNTQTIDDINTTNGYLDLVHTGGDVYQQLDDVDNDWDADTATGIIPRDQHHYRYRAWGFWKVTAYWDSLETDISTAKTYGFVIPPGEVLEVDRFRCRPLDSASADDEDSDVGDPIPPVDDDGSDLGGYPNIFWYHHPNRREAPFVQDDANTLATQYNDIHWYIRFAWLSFGVLKEVRRVRRTWCLIRGQSEVTTTGYNSYREHPAFWTHQTPDMTETTIHFEPRVPPDTHAVSLSAEGTTAPVGILGAAYATEPRRLSYGIIRDWTQGPYQEAYGADPDNPDALDLYWP